MAFSNIPVGVYGNAAAAVDLSTKLYHAGAFDATGQITFVSTAGAASDGVITIDSPAGSASRLTFLGIEKVALGGTVVFGDDLTSDVAGKYVAATTGDVILGRCLLGGASGGVGTMFIYPKAQSVSA